MDKRQTVSIDMNKHASQLGRLGAGKPKNYSQAELERRRDRLAEARKQRWPKGRKRKVKE